MARLASTNYGNAAKFIYNEVEVGNIYDLSALLTEIEPHSDCLIIRGKPLPHVRDGDTVRRRKNSEPDKPAAFQENPTGAP